MKSYPLYKESGVEWIGEIPDTWKYGEMKYQLSNNDGGVWGKDIERDDEGTIVIRSTEITIDGKWDLSNPMKRKLNESEIEKCKLYEGDIVITKSSGSPNHIGKSVIVSEEVEKLDCCYSNFVQRIRFRDYSPRLYHYILNSYVVREQYRYLTQSTTGLGNLNGSTLNEVQLPFIPLPEQKQIVSFLDHKTQMIDELIAKTEQKIELLKEKRLALVGNVIMNSNIQRIRLNHVVENICRPILRKNKNVYCPLGLYNRGRGIFHKQETEGAELGDSTFYFVKENDLIISGQFAWEGAVALAGPKEEGCVVSHRFPIVRGKEGVLLTEYLWAFLTSERGHFILNESSIGSAGRNRPLNINRLMKEKIPVPSLETQEKVAKIVKIERNQDFSSKIIFRLMKEYRQSLISEVVTGKIDVRDEVVV